MPLTEFPARRSRASITEGVGLEKEVAEEVLDELEANPTFLYRRDGSNVDWARATAGLGLSAVVNTKCAHCELPIQPVC
jgi:hypothetical protein